MKVKAIIADPVKKSVDFVDVDVDDADRGSHGFAKAILGCECINYGIWYDGNWIDAPYWSFKYEFKAIYCQMPELDEMPEDEELDGYHCVEWIYNAIDVGAERQVSRLGRAPVSRHMKMPGTVLYVKSVHTVPYVNSYLFAVTDMTENDMAVIKTCVRFVDPVVRE